MDAEPLVKYRTSRQKRMVKDDKAAVKEYVDLAAVFDEVEGFKEMLRRRRITCLNVTGMPIPCIAAKIFRYLGERYGDISFSLDPVPQRRYEPCEL